MRAVEDRKTSYAIVEDGKVIGTCWDKREAELFCAGPGLLEALKELLSEDYGDVDHPIANRARAIIAKAEGKP